MSLHNRHHFNSLLMRALILDLDFTLLHLEHIAGSIEVPGRTRSAWIAPRTIELLARLQSRFSLVLATARSDDGTKWVYEGLFERGVRVQNVVLEDGARLGMPLQLRSFDANFQVEQRRAQIEEQRALGWPAFEWQFDFQSCLVARCADGDEAARLETIFSEQKQSDERTFRDGRKVYVLSQKANKWSALQQLLGDDAALAFGVGDGANDLVWLPRVAFPATFANADARLVEEVRARDGFVSLAQGHAGIADILRAIEKKATDEHKKHG